MAEEKRTRNSALTKSKILAAAENEFAQKGLAGARIDDIARISGFNKNMIYQYYQSKERLYETVLYNEYSKLSELENIIIAKGSDYKETIETIVCEYFLFLKSNPNFVKLIMWENLNEAKYIEASGALNIKDPMIKMLGEIVKKGKAEKIFNEQVNEKQVMLSLIMGAFSYFSNIYTLSKVIHINLENEETMNERIKIVANSILNYLTKEYGD